MKRNTAIKIAIEAMQKMRSKYAVGHNAFVRDYDFVFAERDHKSYKRITEAIKVIECYLA